MTSRNPAAAGAVVLLLMAMTNSIAAQSIPVKRVISPGGIEAWLVEDRSNPLVAVSVGFRVGSASDPAGKEGLAEMVTGLLDAGAGRLESQEFQQRLADLAIDLGFAVTRDDFTGSMRTLTKHRDAAFDLLRLALTEPRFDPEPVERIRGQMLVRLADIATDPAETAERVWWRSMFPDHPYGRMPLGTPESLKAITAQDLRQFVERHFAGDNLVLGVVGDITAEVLGPLLDKTFGTLPQTAASVAIGEAIPKALGELIVVEKPVPQSVVMFGHSAPKRHDPDFYAAMVVNHVLRGGGLASRLARDVREKRGLAYSVATLLMPLDHAGLLRGHVATQNARVAESIAVIRAEWQRMQEEGPTEEELADAKTYLVGSYLLQFTSTGSMADGLVAVQLEGLGVDYFNKRTEFLKAVTLEDAKRTAHRLLDPGALGFVIVGMPAGVASTKTVPEDGS